jgi:hypothetical protein
MVAADILQPQQRHLMVSDSEDCCRTEHSPLHDRIGDCAGNGRFPALLSDEEDLP